MREELRFDGERGKDMEMEWDRICRRCILCRPWSGLFGGFFEATRDVTQVTTNW